MGYQDYEIVSFSEEMRKMNDMQENHELPIKRILYCLLTVGEFIVKNGSIVIPNSPLAESIEVVKEMIQIHKDALAEYFSDSDEAKQAFEEIYVSCMTGKYPHLRHMGDVDDGALHIQKSLIGEAFAIDYHTTQKQKKDFSYRFDNAAQLASMYLQYNRILPRYMVLLSSGESLPFSLSFFKKMSALLQKIEKNYRGPIYVERDLSFENYCEKVKEDSVHY